jgi:hypothetical protein
MTTPDYKRLVFIKNENRKDYLFDLLPSYHFNKFKYFRLSEPKNDKFIKQGAKYIIESWKERTKTLFTGLILLSDSWYYGDHKNPLNSNTSLLLAWFKPDVKHIILYYFNSFNIYPYKRLQFFKEFVKKENIVYPNIKDQYEPKNINKT